MKWKAPATEPSPDCRPLHEVHATAKDDQGHAWSNGEYAARGRNGRDYAWACHPLPAPQAGNDANPRLQPATSQTDNEHDASLWRRIPPLAADPTLLPASGQPPHRFSGSGQGLPDRMTARRGWKKFFFSPAPATFPPWPARPQSRPGKLRPTNTSEKLARHLREVLPCRPHQATSASHAPKRVASRRCRSLSTLPAASGILAPPA